MIPQIDALIVVATDKKHAVIREDVLRTLLSDCADNEYRKEVVAIMNKYLKECASQSCIGVECICDKPLNCVVEKAREEIDEDDVELLMALKNVQRCMASKTPLCVKAVLVKVAQAEDPTRLNVLQELTKRQNSGILYA